MQDNFEKLFEDSLEQDRKLQPGDQIDTRVVSVSDDCIFLETGGKSEGQLDAAELIDEQGNLSVSPGDNISVYFLKMDHGNQIFTTSLSGDHAGYAVLERAYEAGIPVEGTIRREIKGGFEVGLGDIRAFCPHSQMGLPGDSSRDVKIGSTLPFKVMEYGEEGRNILVSNRVIREEEHEKMKQELQNRLKEGMEVSGIITKVQDFGAFVDIQGISALLPVSQVTRGRLDDIRSELEPGQEITAKIIGLDWEKDRITLSTKALLEDPWEHALSTYPEDSVHSGEVARIAAFGAFVTLEPGLDGLIHISQLESDKKDPVSGKVLKKGMRLDVQVISIDSEQRRIALKPAGKRMDDFVKNAYMEEDDAEETYNPFAAFMKNQKKK
ncbi:30S ribosomal protein S1 [Salinispira pacifica]|uniref:SSU ribosomal protein S1p n=1 Tax=Salinispira pacifica TaxID=1307761 RepID=V5WIF3_9SPIO|nr:S1 RNA-binding domain-containing protein [Salinispira pacifica]AHC14946.1 SSU ribosomal protein S1p [Salinispira pacifica]